MLSPKELKLDVGWGVLSALAWRHPGKPRVICLHGWMDNAASFVPLSDHLQDLDLVALEFAGHGHSGHRPSGANYYFTENLFDLDAALDALGWDSCGIIGHSLGAGIGASYACAAPERVDWLAMLDGLGTITEPAETAGERLGNSLRSVRRPRRHDRLYETIADAARTRKNNNPMHEASALLLAERAMARTEEGYRWRTDGRLLWTSPALPTETHAMVLLSGISCPSYAMTTAMLREYLGDHLSARLEAVPGILHEHVEGGHHVHMDAAETVAQSVKYFLETAGAQQ